MTELLEQMARVWHRKSKPESDPAKLKHRWQEAPSGSLPTLAASEFKTSEVHQIEHDLKTLERDLTNSHTENVTDLGEFYTDLCIRFSQLQRNIRVLGRQIKAGGKLEGDLPITPGRKPLAIEQVSARIELHKNLRSLWLELKEGVKLECEKELTHQVLARAMSTSRGMVQQMLRREVDPKRLTPNYVEKMLSAFEVLAEQLSPGAHDSLVQKIQSLKTHSIYRRI
ncbi:MAG: hypothetical protein KDD70_03780 [Bdellovibrionales bacterium]|nr:hypothetical protein [Bdellovibrionales bacterium]